MILKRYVALRLFVSDIVDGIMNEILLGTSMKRQVDKLDEMSHKPNDMTVNLQLADYTAWKARAYFDSVFESYFIDKARLKIDVCTVQNPLLEFGVVKLQYLKKEALNARELRAL